MKFLLKLFLSALVVLATSYFLPFVKIDGIYSALILVVILTILNVILKPILIVFTIPITILTLGLFLLVINGLIILLADYMIDGFSVSGLLGAIVFSLIVSVANTLIESIVE